MLLFVTIEQVLLTQSLTVFKLFLKLSLAPALLLNFQHSNKLERC